MNHLHALVTVDGLSVPFAGTMASDGWVILSCPLRSPRHCMTAESRLESWAKDQSGRIDWTTPWKRHDGSFYREAQFIQPSPNATPDPASEINF